MALTPKQQRFVREYLIDLNATQAAARAGYSKATANQQGARMLANAGIKAAIDEGIAAREQETGITAAWVIRRLKREAEFDGEGSSHSARVSALALAAKHLGMLKEDAPHPDRPAVDLKALTDDALDRLLSAVGPLLAPGLLPGAGAGEVPPAPPG